MTANTFFILYGSSESQKDSLNLPWSKVKPCGAKSQFKKVPGRADSNSDQYQGGKSLQSM